MNFIDSLLSVPRADHLQIAKYIVVVMSLMFVPYISILFGSTLLSLGFSVRGKLEENSLFSKFAKDMVDRLYGNTAAALVLGILPVLTMLISFSQILYGTPAKVSQYFTVLLIVTIAAIVLTFLYRKSFASRENNFMKHVVLGLLALGGLKTIFFLLASNLSLILFPERWKLVSDYVFFPFDWIVIARFSHFMMASFAITGAAILFFFFNWLGGKQDMEPEYRDYVRKFGAGMSIGFSIVSTIFLLWYFVCLPVMAKSYGVFISAMAAVLVLLFVCLYAYSVLRESKIAAGKQVFGFFMLFFLVLFVNDNLARENSLQYQNYNLHILHLKKMAKIEESRTERGGAVASIEIGQEIYNTKCVACHRFDSRVVGPPYNTVLPKYEGKLDELKKFILNPVKVNPDYIAMPNQGLKPHEAESVAMFLMKEYQEKYKNK
jgi:cytochrome c